MLGVAISRTGMFKIIANFHQLAPSSLVRIRYTPGETQT